MNQDVATTLYSLSNDPPAPAAMGDIDRRGGERHVTLYRVGALAIQDRRELCLIKNVSAGGMMVRTYGPVEIGTRMTIELKCGETISGTATWVREPNVGIEFDRPVDVVELLSQAMTGPRPRMPRIATDCAASLRHGANVRRVRVVDVSQGGVKLLCGDGLTESEAVVVTLPGLAPVAGVLRWSDCGHVGVTFNHLIPLQSLVKWLRDRRDGLRATA